MYIGTLFQKYVQYKSDGIYISCFPRRLPMLYKFTNVMVDASCKFCFLLLSTTHFLSIPMENIKPLFAP